MKNILNTIVLLEIISVMCVRHTASFKNNYRGRPITKLFNTPQKKDNDSETPDGGQLRRTWPPHGLGKWEVPAGYKFSRQRGRRRR